MMKVDIGSIKASMSCVIMCIFEEVFMTVVKNTQSKVAILQVLYVKYEVAIAHASLKVIIFNFV